jgi:hypothetical protein
VRVASGGFAMPTKEPVVMSGGSTQSAPFAVLGCQAILVVSASGGKANAAKTTKTNRERMRRAKVLRGNKSRFCIDRLLEAGMAFRADELE